MRATDRKDPPLSGTEGETLLGFLDYHRDTLRWKTDGLGAEQLARRLGVSTMTLGGLLKHLAYVEDWWFTQVYAGRPAPQPWASMDWRADRDSDWHSAADDSPEELRRQFEESVARSRAVLEAEPDLEEVVASPSRSDPRPEFSLRWILVHMVEEYARHNGHADLLREAIDGQVGD